MQVGTWVFFAFLAFGSFLMSLCILLSADSFCFLFGPRQQTHYAALLWMAKLSIPQSGTEQVTQD